MGPEVVAMPEVGTNLLYPEMSEAEALILLTLRHMLLGTLDSRNTVGLLRLITDKLNEHGYDL